MIKKGLKIGATTLALIIASTCAANAMGFKTRFGDFLTRTIKKTRKEYFSKTHDKKTIQQTPEEKIYENIQQQNKEILSTEPQKAFSFLAGSSNNSRIYFIPDQSKQNLINENKFEQNDFSKKLILINKSNTQNLAENMNTLRKSIPLGKSLIKYDFESSSQLENNILSALEKINIDESRIKENLSIAKEKITSFVKNFPYYIQETVIQKNNDSIEIANRFGIISLPMKNEALIAFYNKLKSNKEEITNQIKNYDEMKSKLRNIYYHAILDLKEIKPLIEKYTLSKNCKISYRQIADLLLKNNFQAIQLNNESIKNLQSKNFKKKCEAINYMLGAEVLPAQKINKAFKNSLEQILTSYPSPNTEKPLIDGCNNSSNLNYGIFNANYQNQTLILTPKGSPSLYLTELNIDMALNPLKEASMKKNSRIIDLGVMLPAKIELGKYSNLTIGARLGIARLDSEIYTNIENENRKIKNLNYTTPTGEIASSLQLPALGGDINFGARVIPNLDISGKLKISVPLTLNLIYKF